MREPARLVHCRATLDQCLIEMPELRQEMGGMVYNWTSASLGSTSE